MGNMDKQAVISILDFYKNIDDEIVLKKRAIAELEARYYSVIGSINYDGMPKAKGQTSSPTENAVLNVPEWAAKEMEILQQEQKALCQVKMAIRKELNGLPYVQRTVVLLFYIEGRQWVHIAAQIHYSERQCKNIRDYALDKLSLRFAANDVIAKYSFPK